MDPGAVRLERHGPVATVVIDRPSARNAMTVVMKKQLIDTCVALAMDTTLRVVVLRGEGGKSFASGADIGEMAALADEAAFLEAAQQVEDMYRAIEELPCPTVAVVEGFALGAAFFLALACDFRVCTPAAVFGAPAASLLGNSLSPGEYARAVAALGAPRARELLLGAKRLSAAAAYEWGLVSEIVEPDALAARVTALTEQLASHAPLAMRATKEAIRRLLPVPTGAAGDTDLLARTFASTDFKEGMAAFNEKRPPQWRNA